MNRRYYFLSIIGLVFALQSCKPINSYNPYLGQKLPGITPELFAPSIVNTDDIEINTVFNSSFTELFFTRNIDGSFIIHHSELIDGNWAAPQPIQMYSDQDANSVAIDPSVTQDGNTMYFLGINPEDRSNNSSPDIFRSQKRDGQWQIASKVEYPISTEKSIRLMESENKLIFRVDRNAKKAEIKKAIEKIFKTKVEKINTLIDTKGEKKAYVKFSLDTPAIDIATNLGLMG